MKNLIVLIFLSSFIISCGNSCDCNQNWDSTLIYVQDDIVSYDGKCWIAISQGKGIEPGPWLENGNDIWEECIE